MTDLHQDRTANTKLATSPTNLPTKFAELKTRMLARLLLSEALNLVANMLKSYPGSSQRDLREYVAALAGALCQHPREIAEMCAHPVTGVVSECMFKPTVADVKRWCDRVGEPLTAAYRDAAEALRVANDPKPLSRENRETLEQLHARHGKNFGLKTIEPEPARFEAVAKTEAAILAEYHRLGREPIYAGEMLISPALLKSLGRP